MRSVAVTIVCVAVMILLAVPAARGTDGASRLHITDTSISADIDHMPIHAVLKRIAAYGISVKADPSISHTVTARITKAPMAEGLRRLFSPLSYSLVWSSIETPAGPISKVTEIHVFRPGGRDNATPVSGEAAFEVIADRVTGALVVKGELLIRIRPDTDLGALTALLRRFDAVVVDYQAGEGILRLRVPDHEDVRALVKAVSASVVGAAAEPHYAYRLPPLVLETGARSPLPRRLASSTAAGPIAILDSGLAAGAVPADLIEAAFNAIDPGADTDDIAGHGTHMALIASGRVAPLGTEGQPVIEAAIIPVKIFDGNGHTSNFTVMRALSHAIGNGAKAISLSWGSEAESGFLKDALAQAKARGVTVLAASGNAPTGKPVFPAAYSSVVGVGALSPDGAVWESSNRGSFVALYAPGYAAFDGSDHETAGSFAGTSVATAYTANRLVDFLRANPGAGIEDFLKSVK